jgi:hypothetical protein
MCRPPTTNTIKGLINAYLLVPQMVWPTSMMAREPFLKSSSSSVSTLARRSQQNRKIPINQPKRTQLTPAEGEWGALLTLVVSERQ